MTRQPPAPRARRQRRATPPPPPPRQRLAAELERRHDYEPADTRGAMHTDPACRVCGKPKH